MRKSLVLLSLMIVSMFTAAESQAQSNLCTVQLVDRGYVVSTITRARDHQGSCRNALRDCKREQRQRGMVGTSQCVNVSNPAPNPNPNPWPNPNPNPIPGALRAGDIVFPLDWEHDRGATVIAIYPQYNEVKIKSRSTGSVYNKRMNELALPVGCVQHVCAGSTVFPYDWSHSLGARVIAVAVQVGKVIIKSNSTGNIYVKGLHEL